MRNVLRCLFKDTRPVSKPQPTAASFDFSGSRFLVHVGGHWSDAPEELDVTSGSTLRLRFELPRDHDVRWRGATEIEMTRHGSIASVALDTRETHTVTVEILDLGGRSVGQRTVVVYVAPASACAA